MKKEPGKSILIRFEKLTALQRQLIFEEGIFEGFEKDARKYCDWLLSLDPEGREMHHRCISRIAHAVRAGHGNIDISPECKCAMCAQWYLAATEEIDRTIEEEKIRRKRERSQPKEARPTFLYLVLDERTKYIKIGRSRTPSSRERTLQSENPQHVMFFSMPADAAVERLLHEEFAEYRVRGEWFRLSQSQIESIMGRAKLLAHSHRDRENLKV